MFESEELLHRIFSDLLPASSDAAYLFGQTPDNQGAVFQRARQLVDHAQTRTLLIPGTGPISGYPGKDDWFQRLARLQIAPSLIQPVPIGATDSLNSLIEAQAVVRYAKTQGFQSLFVIAAPFHQQRAVMTIITVALQDYPQLQVYSAPGFPMNWQTVVVHSQGQLQGKRHELIYSELERIDQYGAKGDLASREVILEYLRQRDGRAS